MPLTRILGIILLTTSVGGLLVALAIGSKPHLLDRITAAGIAPIARLANRWIVVDETLESADLIYILNGTLAVRAGHAAEVYRLGLAPVVLISHSAEIFHAPRLRRAAPMSQIIAAEMTALGVPASAIQIVSYPGGVVNTRDEARALRQHLEVYPARRVIVVTTDYHTGRARRTIRQELRGMGVEVQMSGARDQRGITPANWWESKEGLAVYGAELVKQAGAMLRLDGK